MELVWASIAGILTTLTCTGILFLIKKAVEMSNSLDEVKANQEAFTKTINSIVDKQTDAASKLLKMTDDFFELSGSFVKHMTEEQEIVGKVFEAISELGLRIDGQSLAVAMTSFRQAAFYAKDGCYITILQDDGWEFSWGNDAYFKMSGLTLAQAKADAFWDKNILPKDKTILKRTMEEQALRSEDIDMVFEYIFSDGILGKVRLSAIPVVNGDGKAVAYFGAIRVLREEN